MSLETEQRRRFQISSLVQRIQPLRQVHPGDVLQPVKEWAAQFEGKIAIAGELVEFTVDNSNDVLIPHDLGRPILGALLLGIFNDLVVPGTDAVSYAVNIESSTDTEFRVELSATVSGKTRWLVF